MLIAVLAMSSSVIFIKLSKLEIGPLTAGRVWMAALLLLPMMEWQRRKAVRDGAGLPDGWWKLSLLPGMMFAAHLLSWAVGARLTGSANATLAVNTAPLVMPFLLFWIAGERVTKMEVLGTVIAFSGLVVLTVADAGLDAQHLRGDLICVGSMLFLSVYLALGRRVLPRLASPWLYSVPLYVYGGAVAMLFALNREQWLPLFGETAFFEWFNVLGLAVVPTILGHGLAMAALSVLRGQVVAVMSLGQFLTSGLLAWMIFGETPHGTFYVASFLVVSGCAVVILGRERPMMKKRGA